MPAERKWPASCPGAIGVYLPDMNTSRSAARALLVVFASFLGMASTATASPPSPLSVFEGGGVPVQAAYTQIDHEGRRSAGTLAMGPAGQVRWEQVKPYRELIVSDRQGGWHVDYDLRQAVRIEPSAGDGWIEALRPGGSSGVYHQQNMDGGRGLKLVPKPGVTAPALQVWFDAHGHPARLITEDGRRVDFASWNPASVDFSFLPGPDLDVIGGPGH